MAKQTQLDYNPCKKTRRRHKPLGFRHRKKLGPKSHLRIFKHA